MAEPWRQMLERRNRFENRGGVPRIAVNVVIGISACLGLISILILFPPLSSYRRAAFVAMWSLSLQWTLVTVTLGVCSHRAMLRKLHYLQILWLIAPLMISTGTFLVLLVLASRN